MTFAHWDKYPDFNIDEFKCSHTGKCEMQHEFLEKLQKLRTEYGKPMKITSGYRHPTHPIERVKSVAGAHTTGRACDIAVSGADAHKLLCLAVKHGFPRIGVNQKGTGRFIHLDDMTGAHFPSPIIWSY